MADSKPALPAAYRLLVGDELGVLRGVHSTSSSSSQHASTGQWALQLVSD